MFVGVIVEGGVITHVLLRQDIELLKVEMLKILPAGAFDPSYDDMQIFDENDNAVFNFDME